MRIKQDLLRRNDIEYMADGYNVVNKYYDLKTYKHLYWYVIRNSSEILQIHLIEIS